MIRDSRQASRYRAEVRIGSSKQWITLGIEGTRLVAEAATQVFEAGWDRLWDKPIQTRVVEIPANRH
jgi:hypothetical protein